jgi:hypothetical protein
MLDWANLTPGDIDSKASVLKFQQVVVVQANKYGDVNSMQTRLI